MSPRDTFSQTIVVTIEAPRLLDMGTIDVSAFKRKCAFYECGLAEKNADSSIQVPLTTNRDSINEDILDLFPVVP